MPRHAEKKVLAYEPAQLFDLVADIGRYPEFLPWCVAARVRKREGDVIHADLVIGFRMVRERFTSRVVLQRPGRIDVTYAEGPFRHLENHWIFEPAEGGGTLVDFYVDFEFRSRVLQALIGPLFHEAVRRMVAAFEDRAAMLLGPATSNEVQRRRAVMEGEVKPDEV